MSDPSLKTTPLTEAHKAAGARMVAFGGYDMPVQYADGVLKEHLWTRAHCGLFDVSHMGPSFLRLTTRSGDPDTDHRAIAAVLEPLICGDIRGLKCGQQRYTLLLNEHGGICDDLMVVRPIADAQQGILYVVVNAGTKEGDFARIAAAAAGKAELIRADDRGLIAVQGPEAAAVVSAILPEVAALSFMNAIQVPFEGETLIASRSGYTGEDGFEILVPAAKAAAFWNRLLADARARPIGLGARDSLRLEAADFWNRLLVDARARPIGLGARDSLRLEAGLPLYGHDLDETLSPVEADLSFAISKRRLKAEDFPGAARAIGELAGRLTRRRAGLRVQGAPAREGAEIVDRDDAVVGTVTSGGFSPTLSAPIAMGYVPPALAEPGAELGVVVRGKRQAATVTTLPFVPHRYYRKEA